MRRLLLVLVVGFSCWAWELTVAFTTDLHATEARFPQLELLLRETDLILDGGDTWEDTRKPTGEAEAWATMRWMAKVGYDAMVLGNHETYLGPHLLRRILKETPFPVLAANLRADIPTRPYALLERKGLRILVLGVLWDLALIWPGWELLDPLSAIIETLAQAPEYDLFILLGHMDVKRAVHIAENLPVRCDLFILGHNHIFFEEPWWVRGTPIVQAGSHGRAVGLVKLGPAGLQEYKLLRVPEPAGLPAPSLWPLFVLGLLLLGLIQV